jgi:hypothetical protein
MRYLLLLSFLLIIGCDKNSDGLNDDLIAAEAGYAPEMLEEMVITEINSPQKSTPSKIIKTASIRFETNDLITTHKRILKAIKEAQGYVQNDNAGTHSYGRTYQNLTVRIPTRNFDMALERISEGVAYFDERTISQEDVTAEFIDIDARLKAKRALEDVKEMLEIERELAQIREEIEAKQGRLKYLQSQVSLSTLEIEFYKDEVTTQVTNSYGSKMVNALKSGWNGVSVFFLGLLHLWPFLILLGIGAFFMRRWIKKNKK